jgi:AcrR family transcriptional regulator
LAKQEKAEEGMGGTAPRAGRPPNAMAGEVEERILEAAKQVFLERGYDGASLDEIAGTARAGKATLYSRYPGKEALFAAVVERNIERTLTIEQPLPRSAPLEERLVWAGKELLGRMLTQEVVSFMRMVSATASRFPELAKRHHDAARRQSAGMMARVLAEELRAADAPAPDAAALQRLESASRLFFDLVFPPLQFRAIMGGDLDKLRTEIPSHIAQAVQLFMAAGKAGTGLE